MQSRVNQYFILVAVCFLVYANSLNNVFISDDIPAILRNPLIAKPGRFLSDPAFLFNSLNYLIAKYNPWVYHLTNIILHSINTILVFLFLRIFFKGTPAFLGAVLFSVHPVHVEAVTWISGRSYLFIALFIFAAYFLYHKAIRARFKLSYYLLSLFIFSYFTIRSFSFFLLFPFFLVLCDVTLERWRRTWKLWLPFLGVAALRAILAMGLVPARILALEREIGSKVTWNSPILNMAYSLFSHLGFLLWPARLTLYHDPSVKSYFLLKAQLLLLLILIFSLPFIFKKARVLFLGIGIFILFLAPTYSPFPIASTLAERYLYFPSLSLSIFADFFYERYAEKYKGANKKYYILVLFALLSSVYAFRTYLRNQDWKTAGSFWRTTLAASDNSYQAHNGMGDVFYQEANLPAAVSEFQKAIRINPSFALAYYNLGNIYRSGGRYEEAVSFYKKAIAIDPDYPDTYNNLGLAYKSASNYASAIAMFKKAIAVNPNYIGAYNNLGNICQEAARYDEAIAFYNKAVEINPDFAVAHGNLAVAYYLTQQYDLAVKHCDRAVKLGGKVSPQLLNLLAPFRKNSP